MNEPAFDILPTFRFNPFPGKVSVGLALLAAALAVGCERSPPPPDPTTPTLYEGAMLVPGDGSAPIEGAAFLVEDGVIMRIGRTDQLRLATEVERVDLSGRTVVPALWAGHAHPGFQRGTTYGPENHSSEALRADLARAVRFGVGTVVSMGIDPGDAAFQVRRETADGQSGVARLLTAGRGIGAPNAGPGLPALAEGIAFEATTPDEGRDAVREMAAAGADLIKIWVDDRGGRAPALTPEVYRAVLDEARRHDLVVAAHVYTHEDAEALVEAGVRALAHLPRDRVVSDELVSEIVARGVYVMPNLGFQERSTWDRPPEWLDGDLAEAFAATVEPEIRDRIRESFADRPGASVEAARERYRVLEESVQKLYDAGARIVLGADSGLPDHLVGPAEQVELELMVRAGMTPAAALEAGTGQAARFLGRQGEGSLRAGNRADFLVLEASPLEDIRNTRRIEAVYLGGTQVVP